jgi:hypothetical protein
MFLSFFLSLPLSVPDPHRRSSTSNEDSVSESSSLDCFLGDAILPLAEHHQRLRSEQLPNEPGVPGRDRRVQQPPAVTGPDEPTGAAVVEQAAGDDGAVPGGIREACAVVLDGLEAVDAAEGGELDEEVGVEAKELPDDVVVAAGRRPVDWRRVPPLVAGALPPQRQERLPRFLLRLQLGGGLVDARHPEEVEEERPPQLVRHLYPLPVALVV